MNPNLELYIAATLGLCFLSKVLFSGFFVLSSLRKALLMQCFPCSQHPHFYKLFLRILISRQGFVPQGGLSICSVVAKGIVHKESIVVLQSTLVCRSVLPTVNQSMARRFPPTAGELVSGRKPSNLFYYFLHFL